MGQKTAAHATLWPYKLAQLQLASGKGEVCAWQPTTRENRLLCIYYGDVAAVGHRADGTTEIHTAR
jgi:hypothetical protein